MKTHYPIPAPSESTLMEYYEYFTQRIQEAVDPVERVLTPWIDALLHGGSNEPKKGMIVSGPDRSGKTYLARLLQGKLLRKGFPVEYYSGRKPKDLRNMLNRKGKNFPESMLMTRGVRLIVIDEMKIEHLMHTFSIWEFNPRLLVLTHSPIDMECLSASITERFDVVTLPGVQEGGTV